MGLRHQAGAHCSVCLLVELLRKVTGKSVAAMYFAKTNYQPGAIKSAVEPGIEVIVCRESQCPEKFFITYFTYDPARETEVRKHIDYATAFSDHRFDEGV